MTSRHLILIPLLFVMSVGCVDEQEQSAKPIKTTDDIGEFKAEDGKTTVSSKVKITNPVFGALEAYEPTKQKIGEMAIQHSVDLFNATEGRYPKDHEEFMTKVIKANSIRLPKLGPGKEYQYDVENHALMVVTTAAAE